MTPAGRIRRCGWTTPVSALALIGALALSTGCESRDVPYDVLLITVDTLRPDHLHYAGDPRPTSPALDDLAREGIVFPRSYSVAGWTLPAMATLLTGRYPKDHTATDFRFPMDRSIVTLAERLQARGYDTQAYVGHFMLGPDNGFARGFDVFASSPLGQGDLHKVSTSKEVTDLALAGLDRATEPWFVWVHYFDPHFEYLAHPGMAVFGKSELGRYDQEIAHTDLHIGRLLDAIDPHHTIVIFTADHGEEFGEHGGKYHYTLYDEVMRTPLVIRAPFLEPGVDMGVAEQIDVIPTLLGMLGIEVPADLPGRNLLEAENDGPTFFERDRPPPWRQRGVVVGDLALWVIEEVPMEEILPENRGTAATVLNVKPGTYMYDRSWDPEQKINLYYEKDPKALELLSLLNQHFRESKSPTGKLHLDDALLQRLRKLGYVQ